MAMELSKVWEASDFKALTKRINSASGNMVANNTPTPYDRQEWRHVAEACEFYLKCYETAKEK